LAAHGSLSEYIKIDLEFVKLRDDPRLRVVLEKMELSVG